MDTDAYSLRRNLVPDINSNLIGGGGLVPSSVGTLPHEE